ncbi:MAG: YybS family protein [Syntrophales bacterium LBB04]|nr:YybS family protein [Syntrophales bacterium LBB04]
MSKERGAFFKSNFFTGVAVSSLAFLAASLIPLLGAFFFILTPLPIMYYYSKTGRIQGLAIFIVSLFLVAVVLTLSGAAANLPFLFITGFLGLFLSEIFRRNYSIEKTVVYPVTVILMLWCSFIVLQSLSAGEEPWRLVEDYIGRNIQESIQFYAQLDIPAEQIDLLKDNFKQITNFLASIFPSLVLVSASFIVWLNILAAREIFQRTGMWQPDFGDLSRWKAPERLIWLLIAAGGILLVPVSLARIVSLNLVIVCLFAYLLHGLAIISFLFKTKNVHRSFRILCYFLIFAQQYIILLLVAIGVFDLWVDFRKFIKPVTYSTS